MENPLINHTIDAIPGLPAEMKRLKAGKASLRNEKAGMEMIMKMASVHADEISSDLLEKMDTSVTEIPGIKGKEDTSMNKTPAHDFKRHTINRRVVADLRKRTTIGLLFYLLILGIVLTSGGFYQRHMTFSIYFAVSIIGICLFRFLHAMVAEKMETISKERSDAVFFCSALLSSLIWGAGFAIFLLKTGEHESRLLMSVCTAGLCAGGSMAFLPERRLAVAFSLCMLMPAFVCLRIKGIDLHLSMVILLYSIYLILIVLRGSREYWDALENEYLLKIKSDELQCLSNTDALTSIYNRRCFNEMYGNIWNRAIRRHHSLSVILCDIDYFKDINDTFGHLAGDEYLKKVAEILVNVFKRKTDVVVRYGGEEFIVLLSGVEADGVHEMAERLRTEVKSSPVLYKGNTVAATISVGIAHGFPGVDDDKEAMIARADKALYEAKKGGRDRICNYSNMGKAPDSPDNNAIII